MGRGASSICGRNMGRQESAWEEREVELKKEEEERTLSQSSSSLFAERVVFIVEEEEKPR